MIELKHLLYKSPLILLINFFSPILLVAQQNETDSLLFVLKKYASVSNFKTDTNYLNTMNELGFKYQSINPDSTIIMAEQVIDLSNKSNYAKTKVEALKNKGLALLVQGSYDRSLAIFEEALNLADRTGYIAGTGKLYQNIGIVYHNRGRYPEALERYFKALKIREELKDKSGMASSLMGIGAVYFVQGKYDEALANYQKGLNLNLAINSSNGIQNAYANIGEVYFRQGNLIKAKETLSKSLSMDSLTGNKEAKAFISATMASIYFKQGKFEEAMAAYDQINELAVQLGSQEYACRSALGLGEIYLATKKYDLALQYTQKGVDIATQIRFIELLRDGNEILSKIYEAKEMGMKALVHQRLFKLYADSINNQQTEKRAANLAAEYAYSKKEIALKAEQEKKVLEFKRRTAQQRWLIFSALTAFFSSLVVVWIVHRGRQKQKKANLLLIQQNEEIAKQKNNLEKTLKELHATQAQLIQSEKMASLGELTAGIAHEIQNPLNFVNNFSEVNTELIDELQQELDKGNFDEIKAIANDIKENEQKINRHGKRAESIVKGMLQHSRSNSGVKEPTAINALADEYLRLAYHGLKAKDKTFNANMKTNFDSSIGLIDIVPQEIGRVILNLITNAFYAVNEKKKEAGADYEPTITVSTSQSPFQGSRAGREVKISIKDNGNGIPQKVRDKIFQPFFTTKPAGQGTGLGLSLSYDIVKAHGGQLKVETKEQEGTEFIISLNISTT